MMLSGMVVQMKVMMKLYLNLLCVSIVALPDHHHHRIGHWNSHVVNYRIKIVISLRYQRMSRLRRTPYLLSVYHH